MRGLLLAALLGAAAAAPAEEALPPGMDLGANVLVRPQALAPFFAALRAISPTSGAGGRAVVLHLGDSHLQSDLLSRPLRLDFQRRFGDAGRGLVFPYTVARTTEAEDLKDESNAAWVARRSAVKAPAGWEDLDAGVSGFALLTRVPTYVLRLGLTGGETFDQVTVFRRHDPRALGMQVSVHADPAVLERAGLIPKDLLHTVQHGDTLYHLAKVYGTTVAVLMKWNRMQDARLWPGDDLVVGRSRAPAADAVVPPGFEDVARLPGGGAGAVSETVRLRAPVSDVFLRGRQDDPSQDTAVVDGVVLEHAGAPGVLYDAAGVNGAQARSFAQSPRFLAEAQALRPNLVILSFGTNEADGGEADVRGMGRTLLALALAFTQGVSPAAAVLVTTPPDGLDWKGRYNPRSAEAAAVVRETAAEEGLALWDWNAVMGGERRAKQWRALGLMESDGVHLTPAGYRLEERLLWKALMDAYEHP